ncbi:hypothetical protein A2454_02845 [Candidatus Peribacteria bacterium RIFOXYC2_FULL_55_14]|nr:MAG: hypothetical protein A2198_01225 [Candidatus Peribacteria bacterium RIFOXYA1_FULL_56_14]OGJ73744.1 MAG: hypothetical protein A2384_04170 [Candidatus Peribacteria bacterium RIFOXYB1_FULL_54_35]OGJ74872.1 MAG: hypothetical protein A2217_02640 [Candidatus Peribacteria bacterium RIFOXYA2_FULL_55_28]OGJ77160.1 MAG: hypothetical protein A2327_05745 [Candidatus Peribacteria bacterium RIFOXYB2_FULL_54_17]OGJ78594.1 MAG: hypothetical protein A2424_06735 [Candidatus Peribacteria bacterium RIFOXYC
MKILFLNDDYPEEGGSSVAGVVRTLDHGLTEAGHEVYVIATHRKEKHPSIIRRGHIVSIPASYRQSLRHYHCLRIPAVSKMLDGEIAKIRPDVIHAHNVHQYITYNALRIARKHTDKVFITLHDVMSFNFGRLATDRFLKTEGQDVRTSWIDHLKQAQLQWNPLRNVIIRNIMNANVKEVFAVSAALKRALDAHGIPRVSVVPNGIDAASWVVSPETVDAFKTKHDLHGKKVILFGGRLSRDKGSTPLLQALQAIRGSVPNVALLVIGNNDRWEGLLREAGAENFRDCIRCPGWMTMEEMKAAYGSADVVTTPSLCLDTFNLMNIEAMALGKPVVGTVFGGTPEIVVNGVTGFICNPLKTEEYANHLLTLLKNDTLAEKMGRAGRERVEKLFTMERQAQKYLNLYGR